MILTKNPNSVSSLADNPYAYKPIITSYASLGLLAKDLKKKKYKTILIDGGHTLLRSFIVESLLNELFLTIAPKIFAGSSTEFLTMVEGKLIRPKDVKKWKLIAVKVVDS